MPAAKCATFWFPRGPKLSHSSSKAWVRSSTRLIACLSFTLALPSFPAQTPGDSGSERADISRRLEQARALAYARESAELFRKSGDRQGEAQAVNRLGAQELYRGEYTAARDHFEQALALSRSINYRQGEVDQFNNLGTVFIFQGRYLDAL